MSHRLPAHLNLSVRPSTAALARTQEPVKGRVVEMRIRSNWGDASCVGLTGLSGVDEDLEEFTLPMPRVFEAEEGSDGALSARYAPSGPHSAPSSLVKGARLTCDPASMWVSALPPPPRVLVLLFDLGGPFLMKGLRVWNYNASGEEACRGAKHVSIYLDGVLRCRAVVRKAPGEHRFDFAQFLPLVGSQSLGGSFGGTGPLLSSLNFGRSLRGGVAERRGTMHTSAPSMKELLLSEQSTGKGTRAGQGPEGLRGVGEEGKSRSPQEGGTAMQVHWGDFDLRELEPTEGLDEDDSSGTRDGASPSLSLSLGMSLSLSQGDFCQVCMALQQYETPVSGLCLLLCLH